MMFIKKTILITGASGFIGGRIVERLSLETGATIVALVHNINHVPRIAKYPIQLIVGDVLDKPLVLRITKNIDYIIHCAVGNSRDPKLNYKTSVTGTKNILEAAKTNNVRQMIYFSTVSVYGYPLPRKVNEQTPYLRIEGDNYNNFKIDAEKIVQRFINLGLPTTILQPTIVYGPYGHGWTSHIVNQIKEQQFFLVNNGDGLANPVYIDNVVDAVFLALTNPRAKGEKFIISDGKTVTWKTFYNYFYMFVTGRNIPSSINIRGTAVVTLYRILRPLRALKKIIYPYQLFADKNPIRTSIDRVVRTGNNHDAFTRQSHATFTSMSSFDISKAKKLLGYRPNISLSKGMKLTLLWLTHQHS